MRRAALSLSIAIALSLPGAALSGDSADDLHHLLVREPALAHRLSVSGEASSHASNGPKNAGQVKTNYGGTWKLDADISLLRVTLLDAATAQIFVPLVVTSGPAGQAPQSVSIHMNQTLIRSPSGWKVASILPIPVPKP
jgi:hypothetical protein